MTDLAKMTDDEIEAAYRAQGMSAQGAAIQRLLFRTAQKAGYVPTPGVEEIVILGADDECPE